MNNNLFPHGWKIFLEEIIKILAGYYNKLLICNAVQTIFFNRFY